MTEPVNEAAFRETCVAVNRKLGFPEATLCFWALRRFEISEISKVLPSGGTLLDIGCGWGFVPSYFHKIGYRVVTTDYSASGGTEALQSLMNLGIEGHYVEVGVQDLPLSENSIDVVFAGNVIEHLPSSPRKFIADLRRVLKPGGHLILDTKNAVDLKTRLKMLAGISNWAPLSTFYDLDLNPHHHKEYTLEELKDVLCRSGFDSVEGVAREFFFHQSLKRFRTFQAMGKKVAETSEFADGFNFLHPYEYARLGFLLITKMFPRLRSEILVRGRKPV